MRLLFKGGYYLCAAAIRINTVLVSSDRVSQGRSKECDVTIADRIGSLMHFQSLSLSFIYGLTSTITESVHGQLIETKRKVVSVPHSEPTRVMI